MRTQSVSYTHLDVYKRQVPRQSDLTVTLTRESDGRPWTFRGSGYTAASSGAYFHVDTGNYGISNCIIFRPDGIGAYEGTYTVEIDGLRTRSGAAVQDFAYQVAFFDLDDPNAQEPQQPVSGGSDFILGGKEEYLAYWEAHSAPNIVPETSLPEDAVIPVSYTHLCRAVQA